jgi:hypothetical protein
MVFITRKNRTELFRNEVIKKWYVWAYNPANYTVYTNKMEDFFVNEFRKYMAIYRLQQHFKRAITDPTTPLGFNKGNCDFDEYNNNK